MSQESLTPELVEEIITNIINIAYSTEFSPSLFAPLLRDALDFTISALQASYTGDYSEIICDCPNNIDITNGTASISFNGGKDSIVTLFLVLAAERILRQRGIPVPDTPIWRIVLEPEMSAVNSYAETLPRVIGRPLFTVYGDPDPPGTPFAESNFCRLIIEANHQFNSSLVFMGYRQSDSKYGPTSRVAPSPASHCTRILPILSWSFTDVFELVFRARIPLPASYLEGFASCGPVSKTRRHEALHSSSGTRSPTHADELISRGVDSPQLSLKLFAAQDWLPAWFLPVDAPERLGR